MQPRPREFARRHPEGAGRGALWCVVRASTGDEAEADLAGPVDNRGGPSRTDDSAVMPPLVARLVRRHRLVSGRVLLGLVDDADYVRDSSSATVGSLFADGSAAEIALVMRALTATLDLRRREVMRICAVICRTGPVVWLPADIRFREVLDTEALARSLRVGEVFLISEAGWRDDLGNAGARPSIEPDRPSPWDRPAASANPGR